MSLASNRLRRHLLSVSAFAALVWSCGFAQAKPTEYQVKAAYLYNFGKFITFPAQQPESQTFNVCILGKDPFGAELDGVLLNATIGSKKAVAKRIADVSEAEGCQIVFISGSEAGQLGRILPALNKLHALTVSDIPRFVDHNGMIQFVMDSGRVRFDVNLGAAEDSGLNLSSQLLKVASSVKRDKKGG